VPEQGTMVCEEEQKDSGEVIIETIDAMTKQPVEDVQILYDCGSEACFIGYTKIDNEDGPTKGKAVMKSKFPICANGRLVSTKFGMWSYPDMFAVNIDQSKNVTIEMEPIRTKKVSIRKKRMLPVDSGMVDCGEKHTWWFDATPDPLARFEEAIVTLERVKQSPIEEDFIAYAYFMGNETEEQEIQMIPGDYKVNIQLLRNLPIYILSCDIHIDGGLLGDDQEIELPRIEFNETFPEGNTVFDSSTGGYWTLTSDDLDNNDEIVFYTLATPGDGWNFLSHGDMDIMGKGEEFSNKYRNELLPDTI